MHFYRKKLNFNAQGFVFDKVKYFKSDLNYENFFCSTENMLSIYIEQNCLANAKPCIFNITLVNILCMLFMQKVNNKKSQTLEALSVHINISAPFC